MCISKKPVRAFLQLISKSATMRASLLRLSQNNLLPPKVWKRLPVELTFKVSVLGNGSFKYSSSLNDGIGRALYWRGLDEWEAETIQVFIKLVGASNTVLDIGANTGAFTLIACAVNKDARVIAFEPVPRINARLLNNVMVNSWQDRCMVRNEACSNTVGRTTFHVPFGDVPTSASLSVTGFRGYQGNVIEVPVTTVDEVCKNVERVDLVKIDVEGVEDKVLEGMQKTLAKFKPQLVIECNPDGPYREVDRILNGYHYRFYHLLPEGPVELPHISPDLRGIYRNYWCSPE